MPSPEPSNLRGALFALLGFAFFATHDVAVKLLGVYSPVQVIFFAVLLSFPLVVLMLIRDGRPDNLRPVHLWWTVLRTASLVVTGLCAFYAFSVLPLAQVYALIFASPLLITLLTIPILGERVGWHRGSAVILGLLGVLVVLRPGAAPLSLGHGAALGTAAGNALASVISRKIGRDERPEVMMLYPMLTNIALMGLALPFVYQPMPLGHLGLTSLIAVLGFAAGLSILAAYRHGDAAAVAPMQYSQMIWAAVFGALFFSESIDRATLIGSAIIIGSGLYIVLREASSASGLRPVLRTRPRLAPEAPSAQTLRK